MSDDVKVIFFENGNCIVFKDGEQVPELQTPYVIEHAKRAKELGYDPTQFDYQMADGRHAEVFEIEGGFNYQITS